MTVSISQTTVEGPRPSSFPGLKQSLRWGLAALVGTTVLVAHAPQAQALDRIKLQYGSLINMDLPLSEIETFATTGQASSNLQLLLDVSKMDKKSAQNLLGQEMAIDGTLVNRLLQTYLGEVMLQQVGTMVKGTSPTPAWQDIRAAIGAAATDGKLSGLEILKAYKPSVLEIDGQKAMEIIGRVSKDADDLKKILGIGSNTDTTASLRNMVCSPNTSSMTKPTGSIAPRTSTPSRSTLPPRSTTPATGRPTTTR